MKLKTTECYWGHLMGEKNRWPFWPTQYIQVLWLTDSMTRIYFSLWFFRIFQDFSLLKINMHYSSPLLRVAIVYWWFLSIHNQILLLSLIKSSFCWAWPNLTFLLFIPSTSLPFFILFSLLPLFLPVSLFPFFSFSFSLPFLPPFQKQ